MVFKKIKDKVSARRAANRTACNGSHAYMFRPFGAKIEFECVSCGHKLEMDT